jgi:hypothetical protein
MGTQETSVGEPVLHQVQVNDVELAYFERHPELKGHGPTQQLVHATGFHARVWDQIIARLPACHSIAVDQRGHGRSEKKKIIHWKTMGQDQVELVKALELDKVLVLRAMAPQPGVTGPATFAASPTWPGLANEFQHGREIHFADKTHFLPMEVADLRRGEWAQST